MESPFKYSYKPRGGAGLPENGTWQLGDAEEAFASIVAVPPNQGLTLTVRRGCRVQLGRG